MLKILEIANYVAKYHKEKSISLTPLKIQKLLYYIKAWGLVSGDLKLRSAFIKWNYGPVNKTVYNHYKHLGSKNILPDEEIVFSFSDNECIYMDFILDCYSSYSAYTLSSLTHMEEPWSTTEDNQKIPDAKIYNYYKKLPFANNFPIDLINKPFYPVITNLDFAFYTDMENVNTEQFTVYPSFEEYKKQLDHNISKLSNIKIDTTNRN